MSKQVSAADESPGTFRCYDMPNDEPEGHYWSWRHAPNSIPSNYRECMTCGRIDASEYLDEARQATLREVLADAPVPKVITNPRDAQNSYWVGYNDYRQKLTAVIQKKLEGLK